MLAQATDVVDMQAANDSPSSTDDARQQQRSKRSREEHECAGPQGLAADLRSDHVVDEVHLPRRLCSQGRMCVS